MTDKQALRICRKKIRYASEALANKAVRFFAAQNKTSLRSYPCKFCDFWHLTKENYEGST